MAQVINTNVQSLTAQRNLNISQAQQNTSIQRLSSGLRINSAKDDAAGLAISERMNSQIRGMNVATRNAQDGISLAQTAEGALGTIGNNLQRVRELAVQSANATNSASDRASLQNEVNQLLAEVDRVAETTNFNGTKLLDGSNVGGFKFQVGADAGATIDVNLNINATKAGLGTVTSASTQSAEIGGFATTAMGAGSLTINGTDIGALAATGTSSERAEQLVGAINKVATTTGVNAAIDTKTNMIVLTAGKDIEVGGTQQAALGLAASTTAITQTGLTSLDITSYAGAELAMKQIDSALGQINGARAELGAVQNRFESVVSNLQTNSENLSASKSRIMDTDFAAETANLTRAQILQQAGTAMLAQANQLPQNVLSLLR